MIYGATKAFNQSFARGMRAEYGKMFDIMTVMPRSVKTQMNEGGTPFTISADAHARKVVDQIGWEHETIAHPLHEFQTWLMGTPITHEIVRKFNSFWKSNVTGKKEKLGK